MYFDPKDKDFTKNFKEELNRQKTERSIIRQKIDPILEEIDNSNLSKIEKNQKRKEVIDLGKFLFNLDREIQIKEVFRESPDFIVSKSDLNIGVELMDLIIQNPEKEREGILKSIFKEITIELQKNKSDNLGIYRVEFFNDDFPLKRKDRQRIKFEFFAILKEDNVERKFIQNIRKFPSGKDIDVYHGITTIVGHLKRKIVEKHIDSKNRLFEKYEQNNLNEIWLLLVINGVEKSSDYSFFDQAILEKAFNSSFNRIFLFDFYSSEINELKVTAHNIG